MPLVIYSCSVYPIGKGTDKEKKDSLGIPVLASGFLRTKRSKGGASSTITRGTMRYYS